MITNSNQHSCVINIKPITMKRILLIIGSVILSVLTYSQPTQGQIFNFSVGDVFETKTSGTPLGAGAIYELDSIVGKTVIGDSVHYTIHRYRYFYGPSPSFDQSVEYLGIDVTEPALISGPIPSCAPTIDSSFIGDCGQTVWRMETYFDTCSIDPPMWGADLYEGLGGEYWWYWDPSAPNPSFHLSRDLIYSNTAQWGECGNYYSWFVGIDELEPVERKVIKVVNLLGQEIEDRPNTTLIYIYSDGTTKKIFRLE
jgi:hypothetical protein